MGCTTKWTATSISLGAKGAEPPPLACPGIGSPRAACSACNNWCSSRPSDALAGTGACKAEVSHQRIYGRRKKHTPTPRAYSSGMGAYRNGVIARSRSPRRCHIVGDTCGHGYSVGLGTNFLLIIQLQPGAERSEPQGQTQPQATRGMEKSQVFSQISRAVKGNLYRGLHALRAQTRPCPWSACRRADTLPQPGRA